METIISWIITVPKGTISLIAYLTHGKLIYFIAMQSR